MKIVHGNRITLLETGDRYFPALELACDEAREEIHLETYIFAADDTGRRIADALARAARRGVQVRLLVDGYGSRNLDPGLREIFASAGVQARIFSPAIRGLSLNVRHLRRLHRKLAVIDGRLGFCGGINLQNDRADAAVAPPRYDFAVRLEGPLVGDMHRAVRRLWLLVGLTTRHWPPEPRMRRRARPPAMPQGSAATFLIRDNLLHRRAIEEAYLAAIAHARRDILIASGYFLPGRRFRTALQQAVARGVRVRLLLQGRPDHLLVHYATHALYRSLQDAGIEIHEYSASHLHAKVACIDDDWATVGSSNIDPFSLWLSREANVVLHDPALVAQLRSSLESALRDAAVVVTPELARPLDFTKRVQAWAFYLLARWVVGLAGDVRRDEL